MRVNMCWTGVNRSQLLIFLRRSCRHCCDAFCAVCYYQAGMYGRRNGDRVPQSQRGQRLQGAQQKKTEKEALTTARAYVVRSFVGPLLYLSLFFSLYSLARFIQVYYENGAQIIPPHDAGIAAQIEANLEPWSVEAKDFTSAVLLSCRVPSLSLLFVLFHTIFSLFR